MNRGLRVSLKGDRPVWSGRPRLSSGVGGDLNTRTGEALRPKGGEVKDDA